MKDEKLVVLREWNSVTEAEMAKSILDGAGIYVGDLSHRHDAGTARGQGGRCEAGCRIARQNAVIYYFAAIQGVREALKEAPEFLMNGSEQPLLLATFERFGEGAKLRTENVDS
mgnify:CR=1 FL=1